MTTAAEAQQVVSRAKSVVEGLRHVLTADDYLRFDRSLARQSDTLRADGDRRIVARAVELNSRTVAEQALRAAAHELCIDL